MPRHKPKAPEDAMDDAYSEPDEEETPSTGYIGAHELTPFEPHDALPEVGLSLPQPLPTASEPGVIDLANGSRILSLPDSDGRVVGDSAPESMPVVYAESGPPVQPGPASTPPPAMESIGAPYPETHITEGLPSMETLQRDGLFPAPSRFETPISVRIHQPQVAGGPLFPIVESPPSEPSLIVHSAPPEPPMPVPVSIPAPAPDPVSFSSPAVLACIHDIMTRIRDDPTYARNLRVRLATMQSNDQGPLTKLIDVIRGE